MLPERRMARPTAPKTRYRCKQNYGVAVNSISKGKGHGSLHIPSNCQTLLSMLNSEFSPFLDHCGLAFPYAREE